MQENVRKQVRNAREKKRRRRKLYAVIACFSILVAGIVSWQLIVPGIAMSGATYCGKEEHTHSEACYGQAVVCGQEEGAGAHTHTEACYTQVRTEERICGQEESAGHVHADACYGLVCGQEESEEHQHTDGCYGLTCGQEEGAGAHTHTDECYATEKRLTCGQEESAGHVHTDTCYGTGTELICGMEEHTHTTACYSNPAAVETEDEWKAAFADCEFTGQWGTDAAAIAESQIGYRESTENYSVTEDGSTKGYTRYADWAGDDIYGDWDTYFAAFVLNYAGVPTDKFPVNTDSLNEWITDMEGSGYYTTDKAADIQAGDLVILNKQDQDREQQIGIIREVKTDNDGNVTSIQVVEGNVDNAVVKNEYGADSSDIVGYGLVSKAYEKEYPEETAEETDGNMTGEGSGEKEGNQNDSEEAGNGLNSLIQFFSEDPVNERLVVMIDGRDGITTGESGETLFATVRSTYSGANQSESENVTVYVDISSLPEGVTLAGFVNGQREVTYETPDGQLHTTILQVVEEGGETYVRFTQPLGATVEFTLQFNSTNGIMASSSEVKISVAKDKIEGLNSPVGDNDSLDDDVTLTWTADNVWDPVDKKVDNADYRELRLDANNKLNDILTYTIKANSSNNENYGEIWTAYIDVTDKLTLPATISLPEGAQVSSNGTKVVDSAGSTILEFTQLQGGGVTGLTIGGDGKTINYTLRIPNQHMNNGVPTDEQENLSLEMKLDTSKLVISENIEETDQIVNDVTISPEPYKPYEVPDSSDSVYVVATPTPEDFTLIKSTDETSVRAGDEIKYTLTLKNTGTVAIKVQGDNGKFYTVDDVLPNYLYLTEAQEAALANKDITYDSETGTLSWIPSRADIKAGESLTVTFTCTVKDTNDPAMKDLVNGSSIQNTASYKGKYTDETVTYEKGEVKVQKSADKTTVSNGDTITYTITVSNSTSLPAVASDLIDELPDGLTFVSAEIGNNNNITQSGTYACHDASDLTHSATHNVEFTFKEASQTLTWDVGTVQSGETIELKYTCKVNTDDISGTNIYNNVKFEDGSDSDSSGVGVDGPIELDKTVDANPDTIYPNGSQFTYTVTVSNDQANPSNEPVIVRDNLPAGMIPTSTLIMEYYDENGTHTQEILWSDFVNNSHEQPGWNRVYYTTIENRRVTVERQGNGSLILQWELGILTAGQTVELKYTTILQMSDEQLSGGSHSFTNTVTTRDESASVTVKGGQSTGWMKLYKTINDIMQYNVPDEYKDIVFEITGNEKADFSGAALDLSGATGSNDNLEYNSETHTLSIKFSDFSNQNQSWVEVSYTLSNLPEGYYTVTEKNADIEGQIRTTTYNITVNGNPWHNDIPYVQADRETVVRIDNTYTDQPAVDIQKSVYAIYNREQTGATNYSWSLNSSKSLFSMDLDGSTEKFVIYNITVVNTGGTEVSMSNLIDELPEGVTYVGISPNNNQSGSGTANIGFSNSISTDGGYNPVNGYSGNDIVSVNIHADNETNENTVSMTLGNNGDGITLQPGKAFTFLMLCQIDKSVVEGAPLENTAKVVVDNEVGYVDYPEILVTGTNSSSQNNGSSNDEGADSAGEGKHYISSSVIITPENVIVPGIKKEATDYISAGTTDKIPLTDETNIVPYSIVRWEITLYNDGTQPITSYTLEDVVEEPFQLISEDYLDTASDDLRNALSDLYQFTVGGYSTKLALPHDSVSEYTFNFEGENYAIAPGQTATLVIYTFNNSERYKTYRNTATFLPTNYEKIDANSVTHGELVRNDNGEYIGVRAQDEVNALGQYASHSWKTITEKGNEENTARGDQEVNYIVVDSDKDVTYTNNVYNSSNHPFEDLVMIDLMPTLNDTGVINQNDNRGSQFAVDFAGSLNIVITSGSGETTTTREVTDYTIQYSNKVSFTDADFDGISADGWSDTWDENSKSFRIVLGDSVELAAGETLVVEYDGKIASDASPGDIAWNSFGYQYNCDGRDDLRAEPPKVGVMIPTDSIIKKVVVDANNDEQPYDASKTFTFEIRHQSRETQQTEKLGEIVICQGGYINMSELTDAEGDPITLENGETYIIEEIKVPDDYEYVGIGLEGGQLSNTYSFTYYSNSTIVIAARNRVESYQYELPETGGIGTTGYLTGGAILMMSSCLLGGYRMRRKRERRDR